MSNFRYSICEPDNPKIIEKGKIDSKEIMKTFNEFPWRKHLEDMENLTEIYFSPSLEFENLNNKNGLSISAVGKPDQYAFYAFFKRPKMKKTWFGLSEKMDENYTSDLLDINEIQTIEMLQALVDNKLGFLEEKFK